MRLRSADDDVTDMTSQLASGGRRLSDVNSSGRWSTDRVNVLTIANATHRDSGLFVCYYATSSRRSAFHVLHLTVIDDHSPVKGL